MRDAPSSWIQPAAGPLRMARPPYAGEDFSLDMDKTIRALDSTIIDLSLTLLPWADYGTTKSGIMPTS